MTLQQVRRHGFALGLVVSVACALRIAWIIAVHPDPTDGRFDDTVWYYGSAHYISIGAGYVNPFSGFATASWPPAYPYFLAIVFKVFGEGIAQAYGANLVLTAGTIVIVYCIGLRLFERRTALIAVAAIAVWPGQIYFASLALSEALFTFVFSLALLLALMIPEARAWRFPLVVLFGLCAGVAVLTRAQALLLLPLGLAAWTLAGMRWRMALAWTVLAAASIGAVLTPWAMRNEKELDSPVLIASNLGTNLLLGHYDGSTGRSAPKTALPLPDRGTLSFPRYEAVASDAGAKKAVKYMFTHPRDELSLSGAKIRALYESDTTALDWIWGWNCCAREEPRIEFLRNLANGFWFVALGFAGIGLALLWREMRGPVAILPLTIGLWTFGHLVFFGDPRYHYPIIFVFALLGARGLVLLYEGARPRRAALRQGYAPA